MTEQYLAPEEQDELAHPDIVEPHADAEPGDLMGPRTDVPEGGTVDDSDGVVDSNWPDDAVAVDQDEVM
jgi:hypothetical protein